MLSPAWAFVSHSDLNSTFSHSRPSANPQSMAMALTAMPCAASTFQEVVLFIPKLPLQLCVNESYDSLSINSVGEQERE